MTEERLILAELLEKAGAATAGLMGARCLVIW